MREVEKSKRLRSAPVYLIHEWEEKVFRTVPGEEIWYFKGHGGEESPIHHSENMATEAYMEWNEITEKEYNNF